MSHWNDLPTIPLNIDVIIDDTTLRDGIQMPGTAVSPEDAAHIAYLLDLIGVERIELHQYQKPDQEAIKLIQKRGLNAKIATWCRAVKKDIDIALSLDVGEIGISHPVSHIHLKAKWPDKSEDELINRVVEAVEYARDHGLVVFVHGEDSTRAKWSFERSFINAVADAGASVYRICDTIGVATSFPEAPLPNGIFAKIRAIKRETKIPNIEIHAHDDLGNAVENTMAAIRAANGLYDKIFVSTTVLGMGERAGNAETEKVIVNLYFHHGFRKFEHGLSRLKELADFVSAATGVVIPPNKAIVGTYAFAHESGIHTHGVLRDARTYEFIPPELVGNTRRISIGKQSGKAVIRYKAEEVLGRKIDEDDPRILRLVELVRSLYASGERKSSLKEEEFKKLMVEAGFKL